MNRLKQVRESMGLSQAELAKLSGVKISSIQHYEQGVKDLEKAPSLTVYRLANALECKVEDLLEKVVLTEEQIQENKRIAENFNRFFESLNIPKKVTEENRVAYRKPRIAMHTRPISISDKVCVYHEYDYIRECDTVAIDFKSSYGEFNDVVDSLYITGMMNVFDVERQEEIKAAILKSIDCCGCGSIGMTVIATTEERIKLRFYDAEDMKTIEEYTKLVEEELIIKAGERNERRNGNQNL